MILKENNSFENVFQKREIKFKGKVKSNGDCVCGDLLHDKNGTCYICSLVNEGQYKHNEVLPNTVSQFIGKLDSDGNEIYEGDIIEIISEQSDISIDTPGKLTSVVEVYYCNENASFFPFNELISHEYHVIGNRLDNHIKFNGIDYTAIKVPFVEDENDCSRCSLCHEDCNINKCYTLCELFDDYDPDISIVLKKSNLK